MTTPIAWSTDLPDCVQSWSEQDQPDVVRSEMDVGQPKVRRRSTLNNRQIQIGWTLRAAQYERLVFYYETTTQQGTIPFYFNHPLTKAQGVYRFVGAPAIDMIGGKSGVGAVGVSCQWELLE